MAEKPDPKANLAKALTAAAGPASPVVKVKESWWLICGDVKIKYSVILSSNGSDAGPALLLVYKDGAADSVLLERVKAPGIEKRGKYAFKGTEAEATEALFARAEKTDSGARLRPVLSATGEALKSMLDMVDFGTGRDEAFATAETDDEDFPAPRRGGSVVEAAESDVIVSTVVTHPRFREFVASLVGEMLSADPRAAKRARRMEASAAPFVPTPAPGPVDYLSDAEAPPPVDVESVLRVQGLDVNPKGPKHLFSKFRACVEASGPLGATPFSEVRAYTFQGQTLFLLFASRDAASTFLSGLMSEGVMSSRPEIWGKVASERPPIVRWFDSRGGAPALAILRRLAKGQN